MKILINDYSGHPFQVELSRELAARGHDVLHLYSSDFVTPKGDLVRHEKDVPTFQVEPIGTGAAFTKYDFLKRRGQEIKYADLICARIAGFRPDIFIGCNNPLDAQNKIQTFCRQHSIVFVFWLQDLYSTAIKTILRAKYSWPGTLIGLWYERMEKNLLRRSQHVIPITDDFLPQLAAWKLQPDRITVIENWASVSKIVPLDRDNAWRKSQGLADALIVLYTGTIGLKHNPDLLLAAAEAFAAQKDVRVVVTSEGKYADYLSEQAGLRGLTNLLVLPFQPFEVYSEVLAAADVLVAMIEPEAAAYSVPSKVLSYLCSARPIVLASRPQNAAAKTLIQASAGRVVNSRDYTGFVAAIAAYLDDENERKTAGRQARLYAVQHFDIRTIADRFESAFQKCIGHDENWA
jgi:glycosyltransferase involved in cell wall biosynthesis